MQQAIVIGGGVIGLTSAWWLLEAGFGVTLLEREADVGQGASFSNGGQLSYRYVAPLADQGVPLKALHWMFDTDAPMRFRPEADSRQWRWLASFLARCNAGDNRDTTRRLLELGELSRNAMVQLDGVIPKAAYGWREAGKLIIHRSRASLDEASDKVDGGLVLSPAECVQREPALADVSHELAGGVFHGGEAVADCFGFCLALMERIADHPRFRGRVQGSAQRIVASRAKVTGLDTGNGILQADAYVLAAGIGSRNLAASAGIYLPLYPIKGYSLTAPVREGDCAPQVSVTDFERKILYARIGERLRVAAMADLVGEHAAPDPRLLSALLRQVRATMPRAADYANAGHWAGLRPATPDGAPIIRATDYGNLWLNVGHGALGFTFACGSAQILSDLMRGKASPIPLNGRQA